LKPLSSTITSSSPSIASDSRLVCAHGIPHMPSKTCYSSRILVCTRNPDSETGFLKGNMHDSLTVSQTGLQRMLPSSSPATTLKLLQARSLINDAPSLHPTNQARFTGCAGIMKCHQSHQGLVIHDNHSLHASSILAELSSLARGCCSMYRQ
jgi:hypothetical protein